jgi:hypothetical protein
MPFFFFRSLFLFYHFILYSIMYENTFIDMFDPSIIQDFSQSVAPLPYQNINFFPPTPPQQMHLYPEDNSKCYINRIVDSIRC